MSQLITTKFKKDGAVFASLNEAIDDKNSLYPAGLLDQIKNTHAELLVNGILIEPLSFSWDSDTYILTVLKRVSSVDEYNSNKNFDSALTTASSEDAGWTWISSEVTDIS